MFQCHSKPAIGAREQRATRLLFFIAGFATAAWAALVPFAKQRAQIDEGALGLLLLFLGVGSLLAMPLAGVMATRFGCRRVLGVTTVLICATLPLLATAPSFALLAGALFVFGASVGTADCTFNIQAVIVEKAAGRPMMSGFHGQFSVGGIAGAAGMSGLMSAGLSPLAATLLMVTLIAALLCWAYRGLLPYASPAEGPAFALPRGSVLLIGILCCIVFLAEGAMLDWSGVFLIEHRGMQTAQAGFGFASFALAMTVGRLTGDTIVSKFGPRTIVASGASLALIGLCVATLVPSWQIALFAYALVGLGCANIVPVLFSAVGRQTAMPQAVAVPAVSTLGYAGVLAGPAGIGFVAQHSSLPMAFLLVAGLLGVVLCSSGKLAT